MKNLLFFVEVCIIDKSIHLNLLIWWSTIILMRFSTKHFFIVYELKLSWKKIRHLGFLWHTIQKVWEMKLFFILKMIDNNYNLWIGLISRSNCILLLERDMVARWSWRGIGGCLPDLFLGRSGNVRFNFLKVILFSYKRCRLVSFKIHFECLSCLCNLFPKNNFWTSC